jgi:8-oxo-dGTP pyrophosphatase MutT (NUDIX family)
MIDVVWTILRNENRFLLIQRSLNSIAGGTWCFPGGKVDTDDQTPLGAAIRELKEETGFSGYDLKQLCVLRIEQYNQHIFLCSKWNEELNLPHREIMGVGWFTLAEIYTLEQSLAPFLSESIMYISYLIQHYDSHPDEWRNSDEDG